MLNLSSLSTQSLASCVNYFVWNCLTCFSNTKIGSVTSFSILFNFQGPVAPQPCGWRLDYFITEVIFCQALFSKFFVIQISPANLERSLFLGAGRNFRTSIGSFRFTSSRDSEVILLSQRLALKYNTICRGGCQHFFYKFFQVFSCWLKSASSSWILRVRRPDAVDKNKKPHTCFLLICGGSRDIITWTVPATKKRNHDTQKQSKGNSLKMQLATILQAL